MPPTAIICLTGSELTRGETHDRNGPFLATNLTTLGFRVEALNLLPDSLEKLQESIRDAAAKADLVLISGGLGPTADDCTARAIAGVFGRGVYQDPEAQARMREIALLRLKSEDKIPDNFYKQAEVVEGSRIIYNPVGLAPGFVLETERGLMIAMPGVPAELRRMFRELVIPQILESFQLAPPRVVRAKLMGIPESVAESRLQGLGIDFDRVEYGISARPGELTVKFSSHDPENHAYLDTVREVLVEEFNDDLVFLPEGLTDTSGNSASLEYPQIVHERLLESGLTVATAESCTGGLVGKYLTDHPGSSAYFLGSIVAYENSIKEKLLAVDSEILEREGAVSANACRVMAIEVKRRFRADYGISVTGIAGPEGGNKDKPVGTVFIGLALPDGNTGARGVLVDRYHFVGNREMVRKQTAIRCLDLLRRHLEKATGGKGR